MSLLSTASPWINSEKNVKKRQPTMKRVNTKIRAYDRNDLESIDSLKTEPSESISLEEQQKENFENSNRIKNLIDKLAEDNEGDNLGNFEPIDRPNLNSNSEEDIQKDASYLQFDAEELLPQSLRKQPSNFSSNDLPLGNLSNYSHSYKNEIASVNTPYYAKMGIGDDNSKLLEKLNYMIHLLEEQQYEKTANITEEFILYTFLGVFVIFIVDSFTKTGKYVR